MHSENRLENASQSDYFTVYGVVDVPLTLTF